MTSSTLVPQGAPYRGRILLLALMVEAHAELFDIRHYFGTIQYDCVPKVAWSTKFCLAGAAFWLSGADRSTRPDGSAKGFIHQRACDWLGLSKMQAINLFSPLGLVARRDNLGAYSGARAVAVVRHLAETGEVRWDLYLPDGRRARWWHQIFRGLRVR